MEEVAENAGDSCPIWKLMVVRGQGGLGKIGKKYGKHGKGIWNGGRRVPGAGCLTRVVESR